jgi:hypothetical protein
MRLARIGKRLQEFDDRYAEKVRDLIIPKAQDNSARSLAGGIMGTPLSHGPAGVQFSLDEMKGISQMGIPIGAAEAAMGYAPLVASATARYVVPGAMITAAGAGLSDLTQNFYDSMSNTPVLPS